MKRHSGNILNCSLGDLIKILTSVYLAKWSKHIFNWHLWQWRFSRIGRENFQLSVAILHWGHSSCMCSHRDLRILDHDFQFYFRLQRSHPAGYRHHMWRKGNTQPKLNIKHTSCIALVWFSGWRCKVQLALTSEITTWLRGFFVLRYYNLHRRQELEKNG